MSVQTQQFRVVGVNTQSGEDVSVVIDAATKAAAEVKAEQMQIETTHIVRLKQENQAPPDEHELFSAEAAEALAGKRTDKLIEEVVSPEEPRPAPQQAAPAPAPAPNAPDNPIVAAITRPNYAAPSTQRESIAAEVSGLRAFGLVLLVLMGISAGAYFVLVYQPNKVTAHDHELVFGQDLFSDVIEPPTHDASNGQMRDAFNSRTANTEPVPDGPPIALDQQRPITPQAESASTPGSNEAKQPQQLQALKLQSVVTTNKGRFAVINAKLYKQGDSIGRATLVSVADDWVLVERNDKQFTLKIQPAASQ